MRRLVALFVIAAAVLAGAAAARSSSNRSTADASQPAVKGGEVTVGLPAGGIDHLEPTLWYFQTTWQIAYATCTPLVTFKDSVGEAGKRVVPGLANLPKISDGGRLYTFTLKQGVEFASGNPITAADIKYTFLRMLSPKLASPGAGFFSDVVGAAAYNAGKAKTVSGITTSGRSISFRLMKPVGSFLYRLTMPFACPVPSGTPMKAVEDGSILQSGPYVVQSYTPQRELVLARNPHYNAKVLGARGKADTIRIQIGVDNAQAGLLIRTGQIATYMDFLAPSDASQALNDATLKGRVFVDTLPAVTYLWLNNDVAPFNNVKVRQAVNYAVNRSDIVRIWGGEAQAKATDQVLPPTEPGWKNVSIYPMTSNLAKAKSLMRESGVSLPVRVTLRTVSDLAGYSAVAQAVQAQLKQIGIDVSIKLAQNSVNEGIITTRKNHVPMGINSWFQDYPHPDDFIGVLLDGTRITPTGDQNKANFNSAKINKEIASLEPLTGSSSGARWNKLDVQIMRGYAPWAPLFNPTRVSLFASGTCGALIHPVYQLDLTTLGNCS